MKENGVLGGVLVPRTRRFLVGGILFSLFVILLNLLIAYAVRRYYPRSRAKKERRSRRRSGSGSGNGKNSGRGKHKERKRSDPKVILLVGMPGSGKSTWLKQYKGRCDDSCRIVDEDELRVEITGKFDDFSKEDELCAAMINAIVRHISEKHNVVVESNRYVLDEKFRKQIISTVPSCRLLVKEFDIKAHFAQARLAKDAEEGKRHHTYTETELEDWEVRQLEAKELFKKEGWSQMH
ncbi:hypothetical protein, conserved [Trypanosoma brucei gambiense DAL972]|uniref:Uncharacterized protein n=1 Tax=Trypanosoma brucei gambiense (strain MHOM/CI/86/DAL972) TaxID=679716 RepID=C9ZM16_TRYB9|nr:hypothetical protein, conserved [Trypanosoma brucei gambiense DAL972]CBH10441.1 hypothetical protein, conserved [Trypanosoma brucei gambiense DAL972]|eukprot:XP_011772731.1 hypothetical protein, conserved [Trypanosoma brucei gambiense DAL972]